MVHIILDIRPNKETKGAYRYQEVNVDGEELNAGNGAIIQSMYIRKTAVEGEPKERIEFDLEI
jgi:hypothetical protein